MSLDLEYRPQSIEDLLGNESLIKSFLSVMNKKKIPQSFMFTGPSGCGKTTLGRIIKNMLEVTDNDYHEINSAEARGIDNIRAMQQNMMYRPSGGDYSVWLIDEAHKMTNDAQNAFLKTLEEPHSHIIIVLCTTDPQKLIKAIRTRCTTFEVEELDDSDIVKLMKRTAKKENKKVSKKVLKQIAKDCMGSPRSALKILDKIIDLDEDEQAECARQTAEVESETIQLCKYLISGRDNWKSIATLIKQLTKTTQEESIRRSVLGYFNAVLLNSGSEQHYHILSCFSEPYYDNGKAGLTMSCWEALFEEN